MKIAVFCAFDTPATIEYAMATIAYLENKGHLMTLDSRLTEHLPKETKMYNAFDAGTNLDSEHDYLFSIGGDGTLLRSIPFVKETEIPILGINTGRLGFLTSLQKESLNEALDKFFDKKVWPIPRNLPSEDSLVKAINIIKKATRPVIIAGGGVIYSDAEKILNDFCKASGIPIIETQAGKGSLSWDHEQNLGAVGVTGTSAANLIAQKSDLVICIGTRLSDFTTASKTLFKR